MNHVSDLRQNYEKSSLIESQVKSDPFDQFDIWFQEAIKSSVKEPNAFSLATISKDMVPSIRIMLLKGFDKEGFIFFTNYKSKKATNIETNPSVCMNFFWDDLERQVRITGSASQIDHKSSEEYFHSRPRGSQIGAWASPQSQVIANREYLEQNLNSLMKKYDNSDIIPKPDHWGGYLVVPHQVEFWQGRPNRLHDRILYERESGNWNMKRLAP